MDPTSIALTAAWLQAVTRAQSQTVRDFEQVRPPQQPRTLTDLIERALITAGAGPQQVAPASTTASTHLVDRLV